MVGKQSMGDFEFNIDRKVSYHTLRTEEQRKGGAVKQYHCPQVIDRTLELSGPYVLRTDVIWGLNAIEAASN